jgi:putative membrane protein
MSVKGKERARTLILCIDRDDDIGRKGQIDTPILSREVNLKAASALAIADPEEADANAMFGAVKLYDTLSSSNTDETYQVATIAGSSLGGIDADRRIVHELNRVLESFPATGVIIVTDGFSDDSIIPIIQSRVPITSIHHVVVKHSERLEETWAVLLRYLKMLVNDPYYSRLSLGVPGIMLVILGILLVFNQLENAGMVLTFILGLVLLVKGFGWDEKFDTVRLKLPPPEQQLTMASLSVGVILSLVGMFRGAVEALKFLPVDAPSFWSNFGYWLQVIPTLLGAFLLQAIDFIILGAMVTLIGGIAAYYMRRDAKLIWNIIGMIVIFWLRFIAIESAKTLMEPEKVLTLQSPLVIMSIAGVVTTITSVFVIYGTRRRLSPE